jgi:hypothetical protein
LNRRRSSAWRGVQRAGDLAANRPPRRRVHFDADADVEREVRGRPGDRRIDHVIEIRVRKVQHAREQKCVHGEARRHHQLAAHTDRRL